MSMFGGCDGSGWIRTCDLGFKQAQLAAQFAHWCQGGDSNSRPTAYESAALPLSYPGKLLESAALSPRKARSQHAKHATTELRCLQKHRTQRVL